jgi:hypothetical protein
VAGHELYNHAKTRGFNFSGELLEGSTPTGVCSMELKQSQLKFEVSGPSGSYKCLFHFFAGGEDLKGGWKMTQAKIDDQCPKKGRPQPDVEATGSPYFAYRMEHTPIATFVQPCIAELKWVKMYGPANQDWEDAF